MSTLAPPAAPRRRVFVVGATGYIGRHVARELLARGHQVVCFARARAGSAGQDDQARAREALPGAEVRFGDVTSAASVRADGVRGERFDAVISCLGSRSGAPADAWRVEHDANLAALEAGRAAGASHFVLLSAICVQRPRLEFQRAKLAFEAALIRSGLRYSIVRPTAFFKSLAGQVERVRRGQPFLVFGDGRGTACKPIAEADLARFVVDCLDDPARHDAILPIGGPGPALTPREQGALLFSLLGRPPRYRSVPLALFDVVGLVLSILGAILGGVVPSLRDSAERVRIGRYYASESMLVWDAARGRYDAEATPSFGEDTLGAFYARVLRDGLAGQELGEQALFDRPKRARQPGRTSAG